MKEDLMEYEEFVAAVFQWVKYLRIGGVSLLMVAGGASIAIAGTEAWKWDSFTVTLAIIATVGLGGVLMSESLHRLIKKHIGIDPPLI
ncbi:hypothetical protein [Ruegeria atlantica]|uniref:hypothetical protein n=1 Tax=Ruegeria atlantica TaxID=81569 RepID=UPI002494EE3B|nr:hypothetical protein [Ruegeria atlantica]